MIFGPDDVMLVDSSVCRLYLWKTNEYLNHLLWPIVLPLTAKCCTLPVYIARLLALLYSSVQIMLFMTHFCKLLFL